MDEIYAKENNLLQLPMFFFGKKRPFPNSVSTEWSDENGDYELHCNCSLGVPGSMEQDTYAATMRIWVKRGMPSKGIEVNYSEIAEELKLDPKSWNQKIKRSLEKLGQARYRLKKCYVKVDDDGNRKIDAHFSLFDTVILFTKDKNRKQKSNKSRLVFPDIIKENLEAKYYQFLDMKLYRSIPGGLARRLYEYLAKRKYQSRQGCLIISEKVICRWLPINDSHSYNRRKCLERIAKSLVTEGFLLDYEFCKIKKFCKFVYSNNKNKNKVKSSDKIIELSANVTITPNKKSKKLDISEQVMFVDALDWINNLPYFHKKKRKDIASLSMAHVASLYPNIKKTYEESIKKNRLPLHWIYEEFTKDVNLPKETKNKDKTKESGQMNLYETVDDFTLEDLYSLLKKNTKSIREKVFKFAELHNYEYVKNNILYANENSKKNYSAYLGKVLEENWGSNFSEEKKKNETLVEDIIKRREEEEKIIAKLHEESLKKAKELSNKRSDFLMAVNKMPKMFKKILLDKAEAMFEEQTIGRGLNVKIEYSKLLLQAFNEEKDVFSDEILNGLKGLDFIKKIPKV